MQETSWFCSNIERINNWTNDQFDVSELGFQISKFLVPQPTTPSTAFQCEPGHDGDQCSDLPQEEETEAETESSLLQSLNLIRKPTVEPISTF